MSAERGTPSSNCRTSCEVLQALHRRRRESGFHPPARVVSMLRDRFHLPLTDLHAAVPANATGADRRSSSPCGPRPARNRPNGLWTSWSTASASIRIATRRAVSGRLNFEKCWHRISTLFSRLAGFDFFHSAATWDALPTHTLRFAEVLSKIYASNFGIGELLYLFHRGRSPGWRRSVRAAESQRGAWISRSACRTTTTATPFGSCAGNCWIRTFRKKTSTTGPGAAIQLRCVTSSTTIPRKSLPSESTSSPAFWRNPDIRWTTPSAVSPQACLPPTPWRRCGMLRRRAVPLRRAAQQLWTQLPLVDEETIEQLTACAACRTRAGRYTGARTAPVSRALEVRSCIAACSLSCKPRTPGQLLDGFFVNQRKLGPSAARRRRSGTARRANNSTSAPRWSAASRPAAKRRLALSHRMSGFLQNAGEEVLSEGSDFRGIVVELVTQRSLDAAPGQWCSSSSGMCVSNNFRRSFQRE